MPVTMRLSNRFYALCTVAACTMLYSAWFLSTRSFGALVPLASSFETTKSFDQRLVVFGDSWSDNKTDAPQGQIWTDWLCSMFSCHQENLAASGTSITGKSTGAVIDNEELGLAGRLSQIKVADLKTQLEKWLAAELVALEGMSEEEIKSRQERTIFVISFGVWDIWSLVQKDYSTAEASINRRIETLLSQINKLSDRWGSSEIKLILTQAVDVTVLPGFAPAFTTSGDEYKGVAKTLAHWNAKLREAVKDWNRGYVYLFNANEFLLDRIRDQQFYASGITAASGLGANIDPGWENVANACVESNGGFQVMMSKSEKTREPCEHPDKYLFWNEMSLGPSAHRLMATEIYQGIQGVLLNGTQEAQSTRRHSRGSAA